MIVDRRRNNNRNLTKKQNKLDLATEDPFIWPAKAAKAAEAETSVDVETPQPAALVITIASISAGGFEKGDFLVREEEGQPVYFDFFEGAFNYIANKGYARMSMDDEEEWKDTLNYAYDSLEGEMKSGKLLMVLSKPVNDGCANTSKPTPTPTSPPKSPTPTPPPVTTSTSPTSPPNPKPPSPTTICTCSPLIFNIQIHLQSYGDEPCSMDDVDSNKGIAGTLCLLGEGGRRLADGKKGRKSMQVINVDQLQRQGGDDKKRGEADGGNGKDDDDDEDKSEGKEMKPPYYQPPATVHEEALGAWLSIHPNDEFFQRHPELKQFQEEVYRLKHNLPSPGSKSSSTSSNSNTRSLQQAPLTPVNLISAQFIEVDTSPDMQTINRDDQYLEGVTFPDPSNIVLQYSSISKLLDPALPLSSQMEYVPGGAILVLIGVTASGEFVRNRLMWTYTMGCGMEDYTILDGDMLGWAGFENISPARQEFCPASGNLPKPPTLTPTPPPIMISPSPTIAIQDGALSWFWGEPKSIGEDEGSITVEEPIKLGEGVLDAGSGSHYSMFILNDGSVLSGGFIWSLQHYRGHLGLDPAFVVEGSNALTPVERVYDAGELISAPPFHRVFAGVDSTNTGIIHSILLDRRGRVYATGSNNSGQLCLGNSADQMIPVNIPIESRIVDVAIGGEHTLLLDEFGNVYGCGSNVLGQLGLGVNIDSTSSPMKVPGVADITHISAGKDHSLLTGFTDIYVTGSNRYGQLCLDKTETSELFIPTKLNIDIDIDLVNQFDAIATSSFILFSDGSVGSCGRNNWGQLGDGSNEDGLSQVSLDDAVVRIVGVGPSAESVFFVTNNQEVFGTGLNDSGQLGVGDTQDRNIPTELPFKEDAMFTAISAARYHTIALARKDGGGDGPTGLPTYSPTA